MAETIVRLTQCEVASNGSLKINQIGAGVGVVLYSADHKIGAGLHILASHSGPRTPQNPIMYANTAIPYVMDQLTKKGVNYSLSVSIAGGAGMLGAKSEASVGPKVVAAVKEALKNKGLTIKLDQTGGTKIRSMTLNIDEGTISIT